MGRDRLTAVRSVVLYSRPDCHLCEEARELLREIEREGGAFHLEEVDIDSDDALHRRFLERIPVIEVDGRVITELVPDREEVRATLLQTSGA